MKNLKIFLSLCILTSYISSPLHGMTQTSKSKFSAPLAIGLGIAGMGAGLTAMELAIARRNKNLSAKKTEYEKPCPHPKRAQRLAITKTPVTKQTIEKSAPITVCPDAQRFVDAIEKTFDLSRFSNTPAPVRSSSPEFPTDAMETALNVIKDGHDGVVKNTVLDAEIGKAGFHLKGIKDHSLDVLAKRSHTSRTCAHPTVSGENVAPKLCDELSVELGYLKLTAKSIQKLRNDIVAKGADARAEADYQKRLGAEDARFNRESDAAKRKFELESEAAKQSYQAAKLARKAIIDAAKAQQEKDLKTTETQQASFDKTKKYIRFGVYGSALIAAGIYGFMKFKKAPAASPAAK